MHRGADAPRTPGVGSGYEVTRISTPGAPSGPCVLPMTELVPNARPR